jgi:alkanesulfonate monooxygenase SsuD/methylene tetrahydromethanopterin reductase-like flavin-dependent oxidoreductase (luciferase family)
MDEALAVLRPLLDGAEVTLDGDFFRLDGARVLPAPQPPVPVVIGRDVPAWQHGMNVWCGLGASPGAARDRLSAVMEGFYQVPFGKFEKYSPCGTAGQIAESLRPYVEAGCRSFNLIPVADSQQAAIDGAAEIRALLRSEPR